MESVSQTSVALTNSTYAETIWRCDNTSSNISPDSSNVTCYNLINNDSLTPSYSPITKPPLDGLTIFLVVIYGLICTVGLLGNGLVIFVITRYTKMKTVTNLFILNLSIADGFFLVGLPMIMTTSLLRAWIFGQAMCKIYFVLTCINWFTGAFTLAVMSGDRFLAVCYPLTSMKFRTPKYAIIALALIWSTSLAFMIPVMQFSKLTGPQSCGIEWPEPPSLRGWSPKIFLIYTMLLGFLIPLLVIIILYTLLILRLRNSQSTLGSSGTRRSHTTKVTKLVTIIISVFILCWLPYWCGQVYLNFWATYPVSQFIIYFIHGFTVLSYANSMINPILYAYTNENFRESFLSAFKCAADPVLGYPRTKRRSSEYVSLVIGPMKRLRDMKSSANSRKKQEDFEFTMISNYSQNGHTVAAMEDNNTKYQNGKIKVISEESVQETDKKESNGK